MNLLKSSRTSFLAAFAITLPLAMISQAAELPAFPGAEGYGRLAKGGRGGRVIAVTNLDDDGPGSLRAAVEATGPRTVVFNIGGTIRLKKKLVIKKDNGQLTIAGQSAPGKGIMVRDYTFGMMGADDVILRFIRTRVGTASGDTMDGMGMSGGANNCIYDHCSISWTMDEAFSSRGAKNITLQRTLISEALNVAGHRKYEAGKGHGFAASINGEIGSFHHNLLAHCAGRNWSMAGGMTKTKPVRTVGDLDLLNNVVYNWVHRTTDGEIHQVNFVNNYYKPGPATKKKTAMTIEFYETLDDTTAKYYISGNVMPGVFGANEVKKSYEIKEQPKQKYEFIVDKPLWEFHVKIQPAEEAYENVLNNVGCNVPALDDHDKRIIEEVRKGTTTYKGSKTGLPGIIDNESDAGGYEEFPVISRPADWDADGDGLPDAWEKAHHLNPSDKADGNKTNLSAEGYTNLEMYLHELARDPVKWIR
ncbi:MAG: hypothetical protein V4819_09710 [Verrucomicrobiota bacterium]